MNDIFKYGEKGLEEGFNGGKTYQSWQFYNDNFGMSIGEISISDDSIC